MQELKRKQGKIVPVVITVFADKSFEFIIKTAPAASQLLKQCKKKKVQVNQIELKLEVLLGIKIRVIAEDKMEDLNAFTVESAMRMVAGTARSMGIRVKGSFS